VVLFIDQDYRQRNVAREQLMSRGYRTYAVSDGFEAVQRLEESPVKDAIIIQGDMLPVARDTHGAVVDVPEQKSDTLVDKLAADWRSAQTPVFITLPENAALAGKIQALFEGKKNVKGFIQKPFNAVDITAKVDLAIKEAKIPASNRDDAEDISLRAAKALQMVDPVRSQLDLSLAAAALVKTLEARQDTLRIEALKALGHSARGVNGRSVKSHITKVADLYGTQDPGLAPAVRAAYLFAIGQLDPNTPTAIQIILKALKHEDLGVRTAAAEAVGHALSVRNDDLYRYQLQQRLDVRAPGAGKEDGEPAAAPAPAADAPAEAAPQ